MIRWIIFGAIAVVIGGVWLWSEISQVDRDETGAAISAGSESVVDVRLGDCVLAFGGEESDSQVTDSSVTVVPCDEPHRYEVYAVQSSAFASYDIETFESEGDAYCYDQFSRYTGVPWEEAEITYTVFFPTRESWSAGDRGLTCALHYDDYGLWQGSARR